MSKRTAAEETARGRWLAIGAIVLTLLGWTSIPLFLRFFAKDTTLDAWTANGWRYAISALLWAPVLVIGAFGRKIPRNLWQLALWPSLFNIVGQMCFGLAPYYVDPGLMTFSLRVQIVFVAVGAALMFPLERKIIRSPWFLAGLGMVVAGTLSTVAFKPGGLGDGSGLGIAISVASGVFYAGYALCVRKFMVGINPLMAFAAVSQYTALGLLVLMVAFAPGRGLNFLELSGKVQWLVVLSAVVGIGIGHTLYFYCISKLGVAVSSGVVQLQPITVSVGSLLIFNERLTPTQWCTGTLAIAGAVVMLVAQHRIASRATNAKRDEPFDTLPVDADVAAVEAGNEKTPASR